MSDNTQPSEVRNQDDEAQPIELDEMFKKKLAKKDEMAIISDPFPNEMLGG